MSTNGRLVFIFFGSNGQEHWLVQPLAFTAEAGACSISDQGRLATAAPAHASAEPAGVAAALFLKQP